MRRMYDENQIKEIAGAAGGGKIYQHLLELNTTGAKLYYMELYTSSNLEIDSEAALKPHLAGLVPYLAYTNSVANPTITLVVKQSNDTIKIGSSDGISFIVDYVSEI